MSGIGGSSVLFVPGNRPEVMAKAPRSGPDVIVFDLEDAVPADQKVAARDTVRAACEAMADLPIVVRINPAGTEWHEGDLASLAPTIRAVMVPKYERPLDVGVPVFAGIETVAGVLDARATLPAAVACYFGAEDYVTDLGGVRTADNGEVAVARALVGMAARLAGIPAFDMVTLDFRDEDRFVAEAREARTLGYAGKLCIHPAQVPWAQAAFLPSEAEVTRAERIVSAFDAAAGATIAVDGEMVDEVVARQARAVLRRASRG